MKIYPCAKINIGLNVVEKRPDGYHNLETIFYPIPLTDELEIDMKNTEAPSNLEASAIMAPPFSSVSAPKASNPLMCWSMGRFPRLQPPGSATSAW